MQPSEQPETKGVTVADVVAAFRGARVIEIRGACEYCFGDHIPAWRRGGKLIEAVLPDGTRRWQCHYCGRAGGFQSRASDL